MAAMPDRPAKNDPLEKAFQRLERMLPKPLARALHWLHDPKAKWVRIPLGTLCIIASFFWFLPVLGLQFFPIGLLLIAQDVPFLRKPVGNMMLWLLDKASQLRRWWKMRRARKQNRH